MTRQHTDLFEFSESNWPYPQIGRVYRKLLTEAKRRRLAIQLPTREVYLKGPGMIFKGNPMRY